MVKDFRYAVVQQMILAEKVTLFRQIFLYIPKTIVARDIPMKPERLTMCINHVARFKFREIYAIADLTGIDHFLMVKLVYDQHKADLLAGSANESSRMLVKGEQTGMRVTRQLAHRQPGEDQRYQLIREAIEKKSISHFSQIFRTIPKAVMAKDAGIPVERLQAMVAKPAEAVDSELEILAGMIGVPAQKIIEIMR